MPSMTVGRLRPLPAPVGAHPIEHLPKSLYRYRIRDESISHASRLRQVQASFDAAQRALQRRGLEHQYALSLGLRARHVLQPKPQREPTHDRGDSAC